MSDKTIVKDVSVPGSDKTQVNDPSHEGKSASEKELENKVRENLRAEYDRKTSDLQSKLDEATERLAELEEKDRLTQAEKAEKARLENKADDLERLLAQMDTHPDINVRAWNERIKRATKESATQAKDSAKYEVFLELQKEYLEDKASEEGVEYKDFVKKLGTFQGKYTDKNPLQRAKLCYRDYKEQVAFEKEKAELKKKEAELNGNREDGDRSFKSDELSKKSVKDARDNEEKRAILAAKF